VDDPKEIRKYSERRMRNDFSGRYTDKLPPIINKEPRQESVDDISKNSRANQKPPPKIVVVEIDEPLSSINLEAQKKLIRKAALRKLKKLEEDKK
jgi:hypothetical protein